MNTTLLKLLSQNWGFLLARGIFAVLFGTMAFAWPGLTIASLIILWGAYAMSDGIFALFAAVKGGTPAPRWWLVIMSIALSLRLRNHANKLHG